MYRNKKDVDQHVESLISRLSSREFLSRGYSIGRLYFEVGDYSSCRRYVEQYLSQTNYNAAAHALLGQALQKLGLKEKALEEFKTSYGICPSQNSLVLNICEILADAEVDIDTGRAKYWCDKAESMFPKHPVTFQLREKLISVANPDPQALVTLLTEELAIRPKDVLLHIRLLNLYLKNDNIEAAFTHSCKVEFSDTNFVHNFDWYKTVAQILKSNPRSASDWNFQLLLLTVTERMCALSLTDVQSNRSLNVLEATELLHVYDQALDRIANAGIDAGHGEFHTSLLQHHRGQFAFHAATLLLKKCQDHNWSESNRDAEPLMLIAWHSPPFDPAATWVNSAPMIQQNAVRRWYCEGSYRCSQAGHYILTNMNEKSQSFMDRVSQDFTGNVWRGKLYGRIFSSRYHLEKIKTSHFHSESFSAPTLRLPKKCEVEVYDEEAQRAYGNSLHHYVWILLNYQDYSQFKCTTFDALPLSNQNNANCGPESLCQLDIYAFLYCAALTSSQNSFPQRPTSKPKILPACITDMLCTLTQMKWWDCAFKFSRNELGTEMTDIRATLSRGIETVRCIDNHGLDPELLCKLGRIFSNRAKNIENIDEKRCWDMRAVLYFSSAIPLFEKIPNMITKTDKRIFEYTSNNMPSNESSLLEECKLQVAIHQLHNGEYEKAIKSLENLKCAEALYYLGVTYKRIALDESNYQRDFLKDEADSKFVTLMSTAQKYVLEAVCKLKEPGSKSKLLLHMETEELLREIETHLNKNNSGLGINEKHDRYSSDEYISLHGNEDFTLKNFSTPKRLSKLNLSNYRTPAESQILENHSDQKCPELIRSSTSTLQRKDTTINDVMELTKSMFEENRILAIQILNTMKNTTDKFASLKISVDQVKDEIDECKTYCKDISDLKKQIAELKRDISKWKKASSEQAIVENELLNLDEEYRAADNASTYTAQLPFNAQQMMPPFNQRLLPPFTVPPNPFQLYGQNLFNLYNQYSQFAQAPPVPGAPLFDAARSQVHYPGVFPTPDQMYLDVANLVQQTMPTGPAVPVIPHTASLVPPTVPVVSLSHSNAPTTTPSKSQSHIAKDVPKSMPVNLVVTSTGPVSTTTTSTTIVPPKNVTDIPHNYQIQMPAPELAPKFSFPSLGNKTSSGASPANWNQSAVFKNAFNSNANSTSSTTSFSTNLKRDEVVPAPANDSHNKSRTVSEKSNTSVDNYDPCPDFKPIIPLPAEVKVTTGEEDEFVIFSARAKLYRFIENQWKERGLGEMKLLKHKETEKVRVLMRREQIHKICANHIITPDIEIKPMKNETKAYFWVANDFADEKLVLEKFCIRFKTADIAHQFYETFNKARVETKHSNNNSQITETAKAISHDKTIKIIDSLKTANVKESEPAKTVVGGFTFSSTPAFKAVDDKSSVGKPTETSPSPKVNVFSGLHFKTGSTSLSSSLTTTPKLQANEDQDDTQNKSNVSDSVEEFEPTAEFKPVIPMLALVDTKTGEEDEIVLFEHRAKLLRFIAASKEWKERGIGNIKLLVHKENGQKIRLLMRREQVMKVCCNHFITKAMIFQNMPNMDKAVTWCAQDFSEGELTTETFCLRFKTKQACDDFIDAIKLAQSKLKDESKAAKEEINAAKQNCQTEGTSTSSTISNWGDKFKPKQGSWECKECFVRNDATIDSCSACNSKNPQITIKEKSSTVNNEIKFNFGVTPQVSNNAKESFNSNVSLSGWGDKFKPKQGSWECDACFIRNEPNVENCTACNNSRYPSAAKPESKVTFNNNIKFKFGIPNQSTDDQSLKEPVKSTWGDLFKNSAGSWECKQCYVKNEGNTETCCACNSSKDFAGVTKPSTTALTGLKMNLSATDQQKNETASIFDGTGVYKFNFGIPTNAQGQSPYVFPKPDNVVQSGNEESIQHSTQKPGRPALLPIPQKTPDSSTFDFVFKPKTQTKAKSPVKSPENENGNESDGNEYASEDEGHHIQITPIVPLPDKVKVVTGEEDEDELFGHRAKLFLFVSGEWKERGIGVVKILKHKHTGKLRVVMRREQVFKICLNHALTPDINYNLKDEKNWIFAANDYSEGELSLQRFCLKFKSKEIALDFKNAIDTARDGKSCIQPRNINSEDKDTDDVQFVTETQSNVEEKKKAKDLMLPENFYLYKDKDPCPGCRGCKDDHNPEDHNHDDTSVFKKPPTFTIQSQVSVPAKSPINEASLNKTANSQSLFKAPQPVATNNGSFAPEKENNFSQNIWNNSDKNSIIQKPKLLLAVNSTATGSNNTALQTTSSESKNADAKSIFSTANSGIYPKNSIFSSFKITENSNPESKSIFGIKSDNSNSIFGANMGQPTFKMFSNESSSASSNKANLFETKTQPWSFKAPANEETSTSKQPILGFKEELSFNTISSRPEITFQGNTNFKWEGAGQQLFASAESTKSRAGNEDGAGAVAGEDDYDPHYEPIVDLPDKIVVTTGEEDEEKLFGEHCKLYRFSEGSEWKERGVGDMKVLYHPERKTYRLLFRRQQVHKVVLNMLLNCDFDLLPLKSDRAWTFAGRNFVDGPDGQHETLAVRFKAAASAERFRDVVKDCVRKLQAAAAEVIRLEKQVDEQPKSIAHLRLPKHLQDSARADKDMAMGREQAEQASSSAEARSPESADSAPEGQEGSDDDGDEYEQVYYQDDGYDAYDEEDENAYFSCDCEAEVSQSGAQVACAWARVRLALDRTVCAPKLTLTNGSTGQLMCEMLLHDDMLFQLADNACSWSGTDYSSNDPADVAVTVHFPDEETAVQFHDACESSKGQSEPADQES